MGCPDFSGMAPGAFKAFSRLVMVCGLCTGLGDIKSSLSKKPGASVIANAFLAD